MRRWQLAGLLWIGATGSVSAQSRQVDVLYSYLGATPQRATRIGDEVYVPIETLRLWRWEIEANSSEATVQAEGKTVNATPRLVAGRACLPIRGIVKRLGGGTDWLVGSDTLEVYGTLAEVAIEDGMVSFKTTLNTKPVVQMLANPKRMMVDLPGVRLDPSVSLGLPKNVRVAQFRSNSVRMVVELPSLAEPPEDLPDVGNQFSVEYAVLQPAAPTNVQPPVVQDPPSEAPREVREMSVRLVSENDRETILELPLGKSGIRSELSKPDPASLEVLLPGAWMRTPEGAKVETAAVQGVSSRVESKGSVLVLSLSRPMGAQVWTEGDVLKIRLLKPKVGDGKLAGKIVVVDAGHGGYDSGAHQGSITEKSITLRVAASLAEMLTDEGGTVVMTRKTDDFIPLTGRADIARKNHADFFVSVHVNSSGKRNKATGSITFHHRTNEMGKLLAECIQREVGKVAGIPSMGVWSDGRIYDSGFSVLRNTREIPGVLVEMGFIDHDRDLKRLVQPAYQIDVACAIVKGIKVYLGDGKKE